MPDEFQTLQIMIRDLRETVDAEFASLHFEIADVKNRLTVLEKRIGRIEERFDVFLEDLVDLRRQQRRIDKSIQ
jgi:hypothetical protein